MRAGTIGAGAKRRCRVLSGGRVRYTSVNHLIEPLRPSLKWAQRHTQLCVNKFPYLTELAFRVRYVIKE